MSEFERITKLLRKNKQADKRQTVIDEISNNLDVRDTWMGIRQLRSDYQPQPYHRKNKRGEHTSKKELAEESAKHLASEQWGKGTDEFNTFPIHKIVRETLEYDLAVVTLEELKQILKKMKRRKAPGPVECRNSPPSYPSG